MKKNGISFATLFVLLLFILGAGEKQESLTAIIWQRVEARESILQSGGILRLKQLNHRINVGLPLKWRWSVIARNNQAVENGWQKNLEYTHKKYHPGSRNPIFYPAVVACQSKGSNYFFGYPRSSSFQKA